jgi:hypothetical protein
MKKLIAFLLLFSAIAIMGIQACNKDKDGSNQPDTQPPVAIAGNDTILLMTACENKVVIRLSGQNSYDPVNNNTLSFRWKQLSGPVQAFVGVDSTQSVANVNLVSGEYKFELEVTDYSGLSSKDSILVNIKNAADPVDLDVDITTAFEFHDNTPDFYYGDIYTDIVSIFGELIISNENFAINFNEYSDSSVINTQYTNSFSLYNTVGNMNKYFNGICSFNFETLYLNGGGAFEGTILLNSGSAYLSCGSITPDLSPIQITGNLNVATKIITMKLKGRIFL